MPILFAVFPKNYSKYIEPFGGSGAVLFGKPKDKFEVFNDFDSELVNLFRVVRDQPAEFLLELDLLPLNSREEFKAWVDFATSGTAAEVHLPTQLEIIENLVPMQQWAEQMKRILRQRVEYRDVRQAAAFFKRMRHSYSSGGRSFACQPMSIRSTFQQIRESSKRLEDVVIENQSFEVLIPHYDREDAFIYADPPYVQSEYVYNADFSWEHHVMLRDILMNSKGRFLVSQLDCPEIRELYRGCDMLDFQRIHWMAQRTNPGAQFHEILIGNYDLLERERDLPSQISMTEMMGQPIDVEQILKERILPWKNRT